MLYGTDNIMQSILHIQIEYEKYFAKNCQSRKTLLWIWIKNESFKIYKVYSLFSIHLKFMLKLDQDFVLHFKLSLLCSTSNFQSSRFNVIFVCQLCGIIVLNKLSFASSFWFFFYIYIYIDWSQTLTYVEMLKVYTIG